VSLSFHVQIEPAAEPITGWIDLEGTPPQAFSGWLELMARLADIVSAAAQASGPGPQRQ
jgi:hypothetical protein